MSAIRFGNFELVREAGAGGMGTVWEGRHLGTDTPVAVKLLTSSKARNPAYLAAFETEVRAIARLTHPRIVRIHDIGRVPAAGFHDFEEGTPFYVMDYVPQSLADLPVPLNWDVVRGIVLEVLDALAHVHARGIVHRDVKPSNVLGTVGRLRLADFGIAHIREVEDPGTTARATGTPFFMAPEQFLPSRGRVQPSTDLYATGCLAYLLLTGEYPFEADSYLRLAELHLSQPFPVQEFTSPLGAWFRRMTAKSAADRYGFAAEAARDLSLVQQAYLQPAAAPTERLAPIVEETIPMTTLVLEETSPLAAWPDDARATVEAKSVRKHKPFEPGQPTKELVDWRVPSHSRGHIEHLPRAGLGVASLRYPPFVGREKERDELWDVLSEVALATRARAVWIDGPAGVGKSRLAEWLAERAHELGIAHRLDTTGVESLREAIYRALVSSADEEVLRERVAELAPDYQEVRANAVVRWLSGRLEVSEPAAAHVVVRDALALIAGDRPLVVMLDDVERFGIETVELVQWLIRKHPNDPLMFVATSASGFERLRGWQKLTLDSLGEEDMTWLVRDLVGLHPDLAAEVVAAADGRPTYAVALVSGWIERRELKNGPQGFELVPGAELTLASLDELWGERLDQFVRDVGRAGRDALELAAALGPRMAISELRAVADTLGHALPEDFEAVVDERGLLRSDGERLTFVHESFRRLLSEHARTRNTWKSWISGCLSTLPDADVERRAYWEMEIEAFTRAAGSYLEAARRAFRRSELARASRLGGLAQRAAVRMDPEAAARVLLEIKALRAQLWGFDRLDDADALAAEVAEAARQKGYPDLLGEALERRARFARKRVDLGRAQALYQEALAAYQAAGRPDGIAACQQGLGMCAVARGDMEAAEGLFNQSLQSFMATRDLEGAAWAANGLGDVYRKLRRLDVARSWYDRARNWFESLGHTYGALWCIHDLAQVDRARGDLEAAEKGYMDTVALAERIGQRIVAPRLNLGIVRVQQGKYDDARIPFEEVLEESRLRSVPGEEGIAMICLLPCDAAARDWDAVRANLERGAQLIGDLRDADLGMAAATAAQLAEQSQPLLSDALLAFAKRQGWKSA